MNRADVNWCVPSPPTHVHMAYKRMSPRGCVTKSSLSILEAYFPFPLVPLDFLERRYCVLNGLCHRGRGGWVSQFLALLSYMVSTDLG